MKNVLLILMTFFVAACAEQPSSGGNMESDSLILTPTHGGKGEAWGQSQCDGCHVLAIIHPQADNIRNIARSKGYEACTGCHGDNGSGQQRRCVICHNGDDLPKTPASDGIQRHHFSAQNQSLALQDDECLQCHQASDMDGEFEVNRDLTALPDAQGLYTPYSQRADFCLRCHNRDHQPPGIQIVANNADPRIASEDYFKYVDKHGLQAGSGMRSYAGLRTGYNYDSVVECDDCHAMHGTENEGLIIDSSLKGLHLLSASLRLKPFSIQVSNGNFSQLCVMCHRMSIDLEQASVDAGNGLSGLHEVTGDCRDCHQHGEAIQAGM